MTAQPRRTFPAATQNFGTEENKKMDIDKIYTVALKPMTPLKITDIITNEVADG